MFAPHVYFSSQVPILVLPPVLGVVWRMNVAQRKRVDFPCERTREKVEEKRYMQNGVVDLEGNQS